MKKKLLMYLMVGSLSMTLLNGCKKDKDATTDVSDTTETQQASNDNALAEQSYNSVDDVTDDAVASKSGLNKTEIDRSILTDCAHVSWDGDSTEGRFPKMITITFDSTSTLGCLGKDGRYRKGKIHIKIENARYRTAGSVTTVTFENYYVNGHKIEGQKVITNKGKNANGNLVYHIEVSKSRVRTSDGRTFTWESTRDREVVMVANTDRVDYVLITGTSTGTKANGKTFTQTITKALKVKRGCEWITEGTVSITDGNGRTYTLDYGDGACDRLATLTYNGKTYQISLK